VCQVNRSRRKQHRRRHCQRLRPTGEPLTGFGQVVTCDHIDSHADKDMSVDGHCYAVTFYDLFSGFLASYPVLNKSADATYRALLAFQGHDRLSYVHSDRADEIAWACRMAGVLHDTSEAGQPQGNSVAERQVQEVKLGTSVALSQAGLPNQYWPFAMEYWTTAHNVEATSGRSTTADRKSPYEKRFGESFGGEHVPFGAAIRFMPSKTSRHWKQRQSFSERLIDGIFMGWSMNAGGKWTGLYKVAPLVDFQLVCLLKGQANHPVRIVPQEISRIVVPKTPWVFPLRERYLQTNGTASGVVTARTHLQSEEDKGPFSVSPDDVIPPLTDYPVDSRIHPVDWLGTPGPVDSSNGDGAHTGERATGSGDRGTGGDPISADPFPADADDLAIEACVCPKKRAAVAKGW